MAFPATLFRQAWDMMDNSVKQHIINDVSVDKLADHLSALHPDQTNNMTISPIKLSSVIRSSATIGQKGEEKFEDICKKLPSNFTIINSAKTGHAGDFIIEVPHNHTVYRILVDIKSYSKSVPSKEIQKLKDDLSHGHYHAAILYSLRSKITGISENIQITTIDLPKGKMPILYMSKVAPDLVNHCIQLIAAYAMACENRLTQLTRIQAAVSYTSTTLNQTGVMRRILSETHTMLNKQIYSMNNYLSYIETSIREIMKELQQSEVLPTEIETTPTMDTPDIIDNDDTVSVMSVEIKTPSNIQTNITQNFYEPDRNNILQIYNLNWDKVSIKKNITLTHKEFILTLHALKTRTKVLGTFKETGGELVMNLKHSMEPPPNKKKDPRYRAVLTDILRDQIISIFE